MTEQRFITQNTGVRLQAGEDATLIFPELLICGALVMENPETGARSAVHLDPAFNPEIIDQEMVWLADDAGTPETIRFYYPADMPGAGVTAVKHMKQIKEESGVALDHMEMIPIRYGHGAVIWKAGEDPVTDYIEDAREKLGEDASADYFVNAINDVVRTMNKRMEHLVGGSQKWLREEEPMPVMYELSSPREIMPLSELAQEVFDVLQKSKDEDRAMPMWDLQKHLREKFEDTDIRVDSDLAEALDGLHNTYVTQKAYLALAEKDGPKAAADRMLQDIADREAAAWAAGPY